MTISYPQFCVEDERIYLSCISQYHKDTLCSYYSFPVVTSKGKLIELKQWKFFNKSIMDKPYRKALVRRYVDEKLDFYAYDDFHNMVKFFHYVVFTDEYFIFDLFFRNNVRREIYQNVTCFNTQKYVGEMGLIYLDNPRIERTGT